MKLKTFIFIQLSIFLVQNLGFTQENQKEKYTQLIEKFKNLSYSQWKSMTGQFKNAADPIYEPLSKLLRKEEGD